MFRGEKGVHPLPSLNKRDGFSASITSELGFLKSYLLIGREKDVKNWSKRRKEKYLKFLKIDRLID